MANFAEQLQAYLLTTPIEVVKQQWDDLAYLDEYGATIEEFLESLSLLT